MVVGDVPAVGLGARRVLDHLQVRRHEADGAGAVQPLPTPTWNVSVVVARTFVTDSEHFVVPHLPKTRTCWPARLDFLSRKGRQAGCTAGPITASATKRTTAMSAPAHVPE